SPRSGVSRICARAGNWNGFCDPGYALPPRPSWSTQSTTAPQSPPTCGASDPPSCSNGCGRKPDAGPLSRSSPVSASMGFRSNVPSSSPCCIACSAADRWREDYQINGVEGLDLHHLYRAMAWLGEELPASEQDDRTPFAPRCLKDVVEERLFASRRDLFSKLDLVFMDTTSLY